MMNQQQFHCQFSKDLKLHTRNMAKHWWQYMWLLQQCGMVRFSMQPKGNKYIINTLYSSIFLLLHFYFFKILILCKLFSFGLWIGIYGCAQQHQSAVINYQKELIFAYQNRYSFWNVLLKKISTINFFRAFSLR